MKRKIIRRFYQHPIRLISLFVCLMLIVAHLTDVCVNQRVRLDVPLGVFSQWLVTFLVDLLGLLNSDVSQLSYAFFLTAYSLHFLALFLGFWWLTKKNRHHESTVFSVILCAQVLMTLMGMSALQMLLPALFATLLPLRKAVSYFLFLLLANMLVNAYLFLSGSFTHNQRSQEMALVYWSAQFVTQFIIFAVAYRALQTRQLRLELAASHAHLLATRVLLQDAVRQAERLRIARDVHDVIGHQLTALNLHLDLAQRHTGVSSSSGFQAALTASRQLAAVLLSEVRSVVNGERRVQNQGEQNET